MLKDRKKPSSKVQKSVLGNSQSPYKLKQGFNSENELRLCYICSLKQTKRIEGDCPVCKHCYETYIEPEVRNK